MFGNNGKDNKKSDYGSRNSGASSSSNNSGGVNTIDESTTIRGNLEAGGDIRIDGKLIGDLVCKAKLIIGPKGMIDGDVDCINAMIEGGFTGTLLVREMLTLKDTAEIDGAIRAKKMAVSAGCKISGQCTVTGDSDPAAASKPRNGNDQNRKNVNPLKEKQGAPVKA